MAVIEPLNEAPAEEEERFPNTKNPSKDESASSSSAAVDVTEGYASDGFETASEAGFNEDDVGREESERIGEDSSKVEKRTADQGETQEEGQVELNHEEIYEKALAEANNAKLEGNNLFKDGLYEDALLKYDIALQAVQSIPSSSELCSMCHANRAACYSKLGKFEDTIKECTKALELNPKYVKVLLRRAEAHEKLEHFEEAITDMTKILEIDPSNDQARRSIVRLKPLADEKREKMKEEMIGKLKEMGNSVLGRFGMSIDNFKAVKDPNTGSYSISFQR